MNDNQIREQIRKRLIQCRTEKGCSQKDVGTIVGKSENAVASWEQGLSLPSIVTLYRLSLYYNKTLEYFYGEAEK